MLPNEYAAIYPFNLQSVENASEVISWCNAIENKPHKHFIQFDICEFYPSISEQLLMETITWAKNYTDISDKDRNVIFTSANSLLYSEGQPWRKKDCTNFFDITMGSFQGAEVCDLVGLYLLSQLGTLKINCGLYRDDGLGEIGGTNRQIENIKKKICEIFRKNNLKITVEANLKVVDFLDVTLDLNTNSYKPFMKSNNTLL